MMNSVPILLTVTALIFSISILRLIAKNSWEVTCALEIVDSIAGDQYIPFLFFLVVIEFEDLTTQVDRFCVGDTLPPFLNYFTMLFSVEQPNKSILFYINKR